jgi:catechol 2,3-dioxygenase-like lactoylglutathione lyase family enzyme
MTVAEDKTVKTTLDRMDHVAVPVKDIQIAIEWYRQRFRCNVLYRDESWAMIEFANIKLALVLPSQHPGHLSFVSPRASEFGELKLHRDGTRSVYVTDPDGNSVELLAAD